MADRRVADVVSRPVDIHRILLPIDGSPSEHAAIDYAVVLALALHASITLVHVNEIANSMIGIVPGASIEGDLTGETAVWDTWIATTAAGLAARGVTVAHAHCLVAPRVDHAIVELARREGFDLIVMASHTRTGLSRFVLGSVAEQVLRHAPCPVLTIHHPDPVVAI